MADASLGNSPNRIRILTWVDGNSVRMVADTYEGCNDEWGQRSLLRVARNAGAIRGSRSSGDQRSSSGSVSVRG